MLERWKHVRLPHAGSSIRVDCDGIEIAAEVTGSGPAVLLLHGYPETKAMWREVAAELATGHTVVAADLRGYGDSAKPAGDRYSKREMARDQLSLMQSLGFERFAVIGHDRGGRVGHRLALDHPDAVAGLAVLDIVPTLHMFENVDLSMATAYFHWFFLARNDGVPEALISAAPSAWLDSRFAGRSLDGSGIVPDAAAEYARSFDAETIRASCADYRAAASVDLDHDRADRTAGRIVTAPLFALWGAASYVGRNFDVIDVWRQYGSTVSGNGLASDHYLAEEAPDQTAAALRVFLEGDGLTW
jgi:haloacetate dehalogenase